VRGIKNVLTDKRKEPGAHIQERKEVRELVTKEIFPSIHLLHLHRALLSFSLYVCVTTTTELCVFLLHVLSFMLSCSSLEIPLQQLMMSSTSRKRTGKKEDDAKQLAALYFPWCAFQRCATESIVIRIYTSNFNKIHSEECIHHPSPP